MKKISTFAVSFIFAAIIAVSAFGQGAAQPVAGKVAGVPAQPASGKIGWIITTAFSDDKEGITKYVNAEKLLETELRPRALELQTIEGKLRTIASDLQKMQSNPAVPVDQKAAIAKQEEGERLKREFDFKQKEAQAMLSKRREEVLAPISETIYQALQEYAKLKGYSVVLDLSAMSQPNQMSPVLVLDPSANITRDFITYYNARPATTATTAAPKK